jgi:hypothetical protein
MPVGPSMGHVQNGQVPLDDAAAGLGVEQLRDTSEEALTGVLIQVYVAGVGAQEANVAGGVIFRVLPVFANLTSPSKFVSPISSVLPETSSGRGSLN